MGLARQSAARRVEIEALRSEKNHSIVTRVLVYRSLDLTIRAVIAARTCAHVSD